MFFFAYFRCRASDFLLSLECQLEGPLAVCREEVDEREGDADECHDVLGQLEVESGVERGPVDWTENLSNIIACIKKPRCVISRQFEV